MQPEPPDYFFSARCIFHTEMIEVGKPVSIFEERIIFIKCREFVEAFDKAEIAAQKYAEQNKSENSKTLFLACIGVFIVQDPIQDGVEVFSMLRESNLSGDDYLKIYHRTGAERNSFLFQNERG